MRRSARLAGKDPKVENEYQIESKAKKKRSNFRIPNIAAMDNGTMVEAFKYLNYCQLAKNSLVSERFRNLIQTHRHKLALLYVERISMFCLPIPHAVISIFDKMFTPETYNEWVIRNNYSKQTPLESQIPNVESTPNIQSGYRLYAHAYYKDADSRKLEYSTAVFIACVEFNDDNWPAFQHLLDKKSLRCNLVFIHGETDLNHDDALLDFALTGGYCTPLIRVKYHDISKAMVDFVEKFLDIKNWGEYQCVQSIVSRQVKDQDIQKLKNDYSKFIAKEDRDEGDGSTTYVFEFVNNAIGKKLQLIATILDHETDHWHSSFPKLSIEINNL